MNNKIKSSIQFLLITVNLLALSSMQLNAKDSGHHDILTRKKNLIKHFEKASTAEIKPPETAVEAKEEKKEIWRNRTLTDTDKMDMILKTGEGVVAGGIIGGIAHAVVTSASIVIAASPAIVATSEAATAGGAATVTGKAAAAGAAKIAAAATGTAISLPAAITLGTIAGGILGCSWAFNKWKKANS